MPSESLAGHEENVASCSSNDARAERCADRSKCRTGQRGEGIEKLHETDNVAIAPQLNAKRAYTNIMREYVVGPHDTLEKVAALHDLTTSEVP